MALSQTVEQPGSVPERYGSPFHRAANASLSGDAGAVTRRRKARRSLQRVQHAVGVLGAGMFVASACVAVILAIGWVQAQAAVDVVETQAEAIRQGKLERAYGLFSSQYRAGMSLPSFRRWLGRQDHLARNHGLSIWGRSVRGGGAILWGSLQDELGHSYSIRYELIRENGTWRVDNLQLQSLGPDSLPEDERFQYI